MLIKCLACSPTYSYNYAIKRVKKNPTLLSGGALFLTSCSVLSAEIAAKKFKLESYVWRFSVNRVVLVYVDPHKAGLGLSLGVDGCLRKRRGHRHLKDQQFILKPDSKRTNSGSLCFTSFRECYSTILLDYMQVH